MMINSNHFYDINRKYGCTAVRFICRQGRCSSKIARYSYHLAFLTRCIENRKKIYKFGHQFPPMAHVSMRFLRLTQIYGQGRCKEGSRNHSTEYSSLDKRRQQDNRQTTTRNKSHVEKACHYHFIT